MYAHIWIVEAKTQTRDSWHPVIYYGDGKIPAVHLTRSRARFAAKQMQEQSSYNRNTIIVRYRAMKYVPKPNNVYKGDGCWILKS
jgi:hypothetical protein